MKWLRGRIVYQFILICVTLCLPACIAIPQEDGPPESPVPVKDISQPQAVTAVEPKSRCGNPRFYEVYGKRYHVLPTSQGYSEVGIASWYGRKFHNHRTSSGEYYDLYKMTAAHKTLPLPTYAKVTNLENGKQVVVKINDRGPFVKNRLIDLSYAAAKRLDIALKGTERVRVDVIDPLQAAQYLKPYKTSSHPVYLQLGTYHDFYNAKHVLQNAQQFSQLPCKIHLNNEMGRSVVYQVRMGPVYDMEIAKKLAKEMQVAGFPRPVVVT